MQSQTRRPRYRRHRNHSVKFRAFLAAMATKWGGEETPISVSSVASDVLALGATPAVHGPFTLRGAAPPGFPRTAAGIAKRFWLTVDGSDNATIYGSRADLSRGANALEIASWDLSPDMLSLTATTDVLNTLDTAATVATLTTVGTCASVGSALAISAVTNGADSLTRVGHGFVVNQGPFYIASSGDIPAGITALTPYWIKTVLDADTFTLAATLGGALINITDDGTGAITIAPVGVDVSLGTLEVTAHGLATGGGPLRVATDTTLPTGLVAATDYWAIVTTANRFKLASTRANAIDGMAVNLTDIGVAPRRSRSATSTPPPRRSTRRRTGSPPVNWFDSRPRACCPPASR